MRPRERSRAPDPRPRDTAVRRPQVYVGGALPGAAKSASRDPDPGPSDVAARRAPVPTARSSGANPIAMPGRTAVSSGNGQPSASRPLGECRARSSSSASSTADDGGQAVTRSSPLPIYTAPKALMRPRLVPHNRPPQARTDGNGAAKCACFSRRIRLGGGYDRACGGDRRRRSGRDDAGG